MGLDRVALLHEVQHQNPPSAAVDVYLCYGGSDMLAAAQQTGLRLRAALQEVGRGELKVRVHMGGGNFKKQLKRANASGATWAVLLGSDEYAANQLTLKNLTDGHQETLSEAAVIERMTTENEG